MIHDTTIVKKGRKDRKTNMEIKEPYAVVQYNKLTKGIYRADQCLNFYTVLRKTVKWLKKVALYLLSCVLFNTFFCAQDTKYKQKSKVQELPA